MASWGKLFMRCQVAVEEDREEDGAETEARTVAVAKIF